MRTGFLVAGSIAFHLGLFVTVSQRSKQIEKRQTLIAMVEQKKKEEEKKVEPPTPPVPKEILQPKILKAEVPAPAPAPAEPVVHEAPSAAMQALPDYNLNLSGKGQGGIPESDGGAPGGSGTGGGGGTGTGPARPVEKTLGTAQPAGGAKDPDLAADIAAWKPKPTARVKPVYPDEARSSEIEGTVVVEAVIDCSGKVKTARVLQGLGHGLDDAAITAIRKTDFEPAAGCRPSFQKAMKINYAFRLGD